MFESDLWFQFRTKKTTHNNLLIKYQENVKFNRIDFMITNLKTLWCQMVLIKNLKHICEISGEKDTFLENLFKTVRSEESELNFTEPNSLAVSGDGYEERSPPNLELIGYFGDLATSFKFSMTEIVDGFYKHVTLPLLVLLQNADEEKTFLLKQIKARDDEIQEWRATNASLTRGLLKTEPFRESNTAIHIVVPHNIVENCAHTLSSTVGYKEICTQMNKLNMFDVTIKTEITENEETSVDVVLPNNRELDIQASTSTDLQRVPALKTKLKEENKKEKHSKKIKHENNPAPNVLTGSQTQASKKFKAKRMLI